MPKCQIFASFCPKEKNVNKTKNNNSWNFIPSQTIEILFRFILLVEYGGQQRGSPTHQIKFIKKAIVWLVKKGSGCITMIQNFANSPISTGNAQKANPMKP